MRHLTPKRIWFALAVPALSVLLAGCSGQPPASTTENQPAREQEAKEKMTSALQSDPTLKPPNATSSPATGSTMSPGPVPGGGGSSPSPGPVPGGR